MVDTHCHLTSEAFSDDLDAVLKRARAAGVARVLCVGETPEDNQRVLDLARRFPEIVPALGHYPAHLDERMADATEALLVAHRDEVAAIGEVGLDRRIATTPEDRARQASLFDRFIRLALALDLPLSVHSRSAGHYAIHRLRSLGATRVCLHAFDGKARYAMEAAEAGYYLSIPPSIGRSPQKQKLVRAIPLKSLLLESDAPVLGPRSDARNEPANLVLTISAIAELKGLPAEVVRQACLDNTRTLFGPHLDPNRRSR